MTIRPWPVERQDDCLEDLPRRVTEQILVGSEQPGVSLAGNGEGTDCERETNGVEAPFRDLPRDLVPVPVVQS